MNERTTPEIISHDLQKSDPVEDCGWEAIVLRRIRGRVQEVSRHLGDLVHGDACGWESRSVELLKEKLGIGPPELRAEPLRNDRRVEPWRGER